MTAPFVHPGVGGAPAPESPEAVAAQMAAPGVQHAWEAELAAELHRDTTRPNVFLPVPDRPGWEIEYSVMFDKDQVKALFAGVSAEDDRFDVMLLTLASQCRGFRRNGEPVTIRAERITFTSTWLAEQYHPTGMPSELYDVRVTVRGFIGNDLVVASMFDDLSTVAGKGRLDPTAAPSA